MLLQFLLLNKLIKCWHLKQSNTVIHLVPNTKLIYGLKLMLLVSELQYLIVYGVNTCKFI
jgi:hypothetical protein